MAIATHNPAEIIPRVDAAPKFTGRRWARSRYYPTARAAIGKINSDEWRGFAPGTLLVTSAAMTRYAALINTDTLSPDAPPAEVGDSTRIIYEFAACPDGWDIEVQVDGVKQRVQLYPATPFALLGDLIMEPVVGGE